MSEPLFFYVRDRGSRVAHHWDYTRDRSTVALCGHEYLDEILEQGPERPRSVCRACQALTGPREVAWLTEQNALVETDKQRLLHQVSALEAEVAKLRAKVANQRNEIVRMQAMTPPRTPKPGKTTAVRVAPKRPATPKKKKAATQHRQPPRITIVSGGLPGLGKRR